MSDEEIDECPLCMEVLDETDRNFKPCKCGYQVCLWCWHRLRDQHKNMCPACRQPYVEENIQFTMPDPDALQREISSSKKDKRKKSKKDEINKDLANVRVLQRNLLYVVGLPYSAAKEEVLRKREYFGRFGRILKVAVNKKTTHADNRASYSAYITFKTIKAAEEAVNAVHGSLIEGRTVRATYGTTKYCTYFLRDIACNNPSCLYLHELAAERDCFSKDHLQSTDRFAAIPPVKQNFVEVKFQTGKAAKRAAKKAQRDAKRAQHGGSRGAKPHEQPHHQNQHQNDEEEEYDDDYDDDDYDEDYDEEDDVDMQHDEDEEEKQTMNSHDAVGSGTSSSNQQVPLSAAAIVAGAGVSEPVLNGYAARLEAAVQQESKGQSVLSSSGFPPLDSAFPPLEATLDSAFPPLDSAFPPLGSQSQTSNSKRHSSTTPATSSSSTVPSSNRPHSSSQPSSRQRQQQQQQQQQQQPQPQQPQHQAGPPPGHESDMGSTQHGPYVPLIYPGQMAPAGRQQFGSQVPRDIDNQFVNDMFRQMHIAEQRQAPRGPPPGLGSLQGYGYMYSMEHKSNTPSASQPQPPVGYKEIPQMFYWSSTVVNGGPVSSRGAPPGLAPGSGLSHSVFNQLPPKMAPPPQMHPASHMQSNGPHHPNHPHQMGPGPMSHSMIHDGNINGNVSNERPSGPPGFHAPARAASPPRSRPPPGFVMDGPMGHGGSSSGVDPDPMSTSTNSPDDWEQHAADLDTDDVMPFMKPYDQQDNAYRQQPHPVNPNYYRR